MKGFETDDNSKKGKAIEHYIISELLKYDFDVYIPLVDKGIDMIVKDNEGGFIEIQVKSRVITEDGWFFIKDFKPKSNFFIVCHNLVKDDFVVIPSKTFNKHAEDFTQNGKKYRRMGYKHLQNWWQHRNQKGIKFLRKVLKNPKNRLNTEFEE